MGRECGIIERGIILEKTDKGYKIASLDRDGIEIPPIKPLEDRQTYAVGQKVYYFAFCDGTGRIICGL